MEQFTRFCENCGCKLDTPVEYCPNCGRKLSSNDANKKAPTQNDYLEFFKNASIEQRNDRKEIKTLLQSIKGWVTFFGIISIIGLVAGIIMAIVALS